MSWSRGPTLGQKKGALFVARGYGDCRAGLGQLLSGLVGQSFNQEQVGVQSPHLQALPSPFTDLVSQPPRGCLFIVHMGKLRL